MIEESLMRIKAMTKTPDIIMPNEKLGIPSTTNTVP